MNNIPILKETNINYKKVFLISNKSLKENSFEELFTTYPSVILDIYSSSLDVNSPELLNLNSEYFRLSQEYKYLNFILDCFKKNSYKCIININIFNIKYEDFIEYTNRLDQIDKYILLKQFNTMKNSKEDLYLIEDINLLKMFMKGILREVFKGSLFFPQLPLIVFDNYDMSLPLVFKNIKDKKDYQEIAEKHSLYFR